MGANFMTGMLLLQRNNKHVDIRHKCVNKYVEDGIVNTVFVKYIENESIPWGGELHEMHGKKMKDEKAN